MSILQSYTLCCFCQLLASKFHVIYLDLSSNDLEFDFMFFSILECQLLSRIGICNRLAIMNQGEFTCIGSLSELEEKYGSGKIVRIILKLEMSDMDSHILKVKAGFEAKFPKATLIKYQEVCCIY